MAPKPYRRPARLIFCSCAIATTRSCCAAVAAVSRRCRAGKHVLRCLCWHYGVRVRICLPLWGDRTRREATLRLCSAKAEGGEKPPESLAVFLFVFAVGGRNYHARMPLPLGPGPDRSNVFTHGHHVPYCSQGLDGCRLTSVSLVSFHSKSEACDLHQIR